MFFAKLMSCLVVVASLSQLGMAAPRPLAEHVGRPHTISKRAILLDENYVDPPTARSNDDYYDYEEPKEYEDPKEYDESKNHEEYKKPEDYEDYPDPKNYEDTNYEDQHEPEDSEYQADGGSNDYDPSNDYEIHEGEGDGDDEASSEEARGSDEEEPEEEDPGSRDNARQGSSFITRLANRLFGGWRSPFNRGEGDSTTAAASVPGARQARGAQAPPRPYLGQNFPNDRPPRQLQMGRQAQRWQAPLLRRPRYVKRRPRQLVKGQRFKRRPQAGDGRYYQRYHNDHNRYRPANPHTDQSQDFEDDYDQDYTNYVDNYKKNKFRKKKNQGPKSPIVIQVLDRRAS